MEKLAHLRHALKGGSTIQAIEELPQWADQDEEAIGYLKRCYERPRLIHRAHVRTILEAPSVKEGNGKDLRRLHDVASQHLQALAATKQDITESFITSILELKVYKATMFEWQRHSQDSNDVSQYSAQLEFLDLRAQAYQTAVHELDHKHPTPTAEKKCNLQVPSYTANVDDRCVVCKLGRHSLYPCKKFKNLPNEQMVTFLKQNGYCLNCLKPGHLSKQCPSIHRCQKCERPHHACLNFNKEANP